MTILDFSCADEVVAKLLQRFLGADRPRNAFFVFRGVQARHRDPMEAVLERQALVAVAQRDDGGFELVGPASPAERNAWSRIERAGRISSEVVREHFDDPELQRGLHGILSRRLVFEAPGTGELVALSRLVHS